MHEAAPPSIPTSTETTENEAQQSLLVDPPMTLENGRDRGSVELPFATELDLYLNHPVFEVIIIVVVVITCVCFAVETLSSLGATVELLLLRVEAVISAIFLVEYLLRFYSKNLSLRFLLRKIMIIDFIALLPTLLGTVGIGIAHLQFLRLARILRLQRLLEREDFARLFGRVPEYRRRAAEIIISIFTILYISSGLVYDAEHVLNSKNFGTFFDALYFSVVTLTTTGFGDAVPITPQGKFIVCVSILTGVFLIPYELGRLAQSIFSPEASVAEEAQEAMSFKFKDRVGNWHRIRCAFAQGDPKDAFQELESSIRRRFGGHPDLPLSILYCDEDRDEIILASEDDLKECVRICKIMGRESITLRVKACDREPNHTDS